jgi:hypothetical protein
MTGVWKPHSGEDIGLRPTVPGDYYRREEATYRLAELLGIGHMVPVTKTRRIGTEVGSIQEWVPGAKTADALRHRIAVPRFGSNPAEQASAAVLDYITFNTDRHANNWMIDELGENTRIYLIDNGLTFPTEETESGGARDIFDGAYPLNIPEQMKTLARERYDAIKATLLDSLGDQDVVDQAMRRLDKVIDPLYKRVGMLRS